MRYKTVILSTILLFSIELAGLQAQTVKDIDGNVYKTLTIGTQVWMKENLKTTKYRNGNLIGTTIPPTLNISGESTPKYQWTYYGNQSNLATFGKLYTWYAVTDSRNVCPTGWHVPSDAEWTTLTTFLGGELVAGGQLKETGRIHWQSPNTGATNKTGFTALPSGGRGGDGAFSNVGDACYWWSSTDGSTNMAYERHLIYAGSDVFRGPQYKIFGFSVRCLRDN